MTCIVGLLHGSSVYMGADSAGVDGWNRLMIRADEKLFRNGLFLMGFTSSFRMGQLLRYSLKPPKQPVKQDTYEYMVTIFIDAVRDCLKAGGYAKKEHDVEKGGVFLVGYRGRLFRIEDGYQVGETTYGFDAVGCGDELALGALSALEGKAPRRRIQSALEVAERFSAGVQRPFHVMRL